MELIPFFELVTRQGKLTSVLMLGINKIETDNLGSPHAKPNSFFPRIFIYYINGKEVKLDFEDEAVEVAKEAYNNLKSISDENIKYLIANNMLNQYFNIPK